MRLITALVAAGALAIAPAAASAATDRSAELSGIGASTSWTSAEKTGFVYGSDVTDNVPVPHCSELWSCDTTLIKTGELGDLVVGVTGKGLNGQDTLKDIDVHVYESTADGEQGELIGESAGSTATESFTAFGAPAGYYLVVVDWYLGAGSYDGTASLNLPVPDEPEEEE